MVRGSDGEQSDGGDTAQFWFVVMRRITRPADVSCNLRVRISSYGTVIMFITGGRLRCRQLDDAAAGRSLRVLCLGAGFVFRVVGGALFILDST